MIIDILTLFPTFYESPISVGIINNAIKNKKIKELSQKEHITMILGHYEGIDYRVEKKFADEIISVGYYVLSGCEIPALLLMYAISRYKYILNNKESVYSDTFEKNSFGLLESVGIFFLNNLTVVIY